MSTDDSVSDVSSTSGALSHCHASGADGDGGKESEVSCVSSEGTSASCRAELEERRARSPTAPAEGGAVGSRPTDMTPARDKIRSLCLSTEKVFDQGRRLPFINPSSLETLRALVQEIHNSGETDPEMWKDCEGRWLHLFQLVEKQYQEQILAQQEQYQCQIQLIQDEIKALVQLQNRQPHAELSPTSATNTTITASTTGPATTATTTSTSTKDLDLTFTSSLRPAPPAHHPPHSEAEHPDTALSSPPPLHLRRSEEKVPAVAGVTLAGPAQERPTTMLSSGYGTLSAWETGPQQTGRGPGNEEEEEEEEEVVGGSGCGGNQQQEEREEEELGWSDSLPGDDAERAAIVFHQRLSSDGRTDPQTKEGTSQPLTSWAQRQKLRPRKGKRGRASSQGQEPREPAESPRDTPKDHLPEHIGLQDQFQPASTSTSFFPLRRSHSLVSEASGLSYWRLNECDLYHPLPDSLDSGAFLFLQEDTSVTPPPETQLSLKEIYQSKQKTALRCTDWDGSQSSGLLSPQACGSSDPAALTRHSDRTSGFTSPSHFSSPSYPNQSLPGCPRGPGTPVTPDSAADLGNLEPSRSSASGSLRSVPATTPPDDAHGFWESPSRLASSTPGDKAPPSFFLAGGLSGNRAGKEEEGSHTHTHTSTLKPGSASTGSTLRPAGDRVERAPEDPVILSLLRQNLREKNARHVADLRAYYDAEIQSLRDRLGMQHRPPGLEESNRALELRCTQLETALSEANHRVHELEAQNDYLEKKLAEWPERYAVAAATVKSLQQRLEASKRSAGEKDAVADRLRTRVQQLEESLQNACREAEGKDARREREYKMLQDLLGEYDLLRKNYEVMKDKLLSTENKLVDTQEEISDLNRVRSKMESQVKQLEHENQARHRYVSHGNTQPSGAGLYHHPDLLLSPSKAKMEPGVSHRRSPGQPTGGRKSQTAQRRSPFTQATQTNQTPGQRLSPCPLQNDHAALPGGPAECPPTGTGWSLSLPERDLSRPPSRHQTQVHQDPSAAARDLGRRESQSPLTPVMRALMELEETRATQSRAPWVCSHRSTLGFVERRHKEPIQDHQDRISAARNGLVLVPERDGSVSGSGAKSCGGAERATALLRAQRSLSPEGHRSSSLPPAAHRTIPPPTTPTKRETLLLPRSAIASPKRSPTENYSTAFSHMLPRQQHLQDSQLGAGRDPRRHSFHSSSPTKRLQFSEPSQQDDSGPQGSPGSSHPAEGASQPGWEEAVRPAPPEAPRACSPPLQARVHTLAEAERLLDDLTQEKQQIEAVLSRLPGSGGRVSLQNRLDEVALEDRLDRLNRDLGSIRMTLKRFNVLRSSANI